MLWRWIIAVYCDSRAKYEHVVWAKYRDFSVKAGGMKIYSKQYWAREMVVKLQLDFLFKVFFSNVCLNVFNCK